jgi:cytochrome o ubiquinol oxidase subunit 2
MKLNVLVYLSNIKQLATRLTSQLSKAKRTVMTFVVMAASTLLLTGCQSGVLNPMGLVANEERKLLIAATCVMLIVVIPTILMSFAFAFMYRKNKKATYKPDWAHNNWIEAICWGIPCIIIIVLGIWAWNTTHKFDPYRKLDIGGKPMVIQAVALRWKWLFIYPGQNIATVNYVELPVNRQIEFQITSDAPMNAFFVPSLASQIYSMAGMRTRLHAIAQRTGEMQGFSANFSGTGFTDMNFKVYSVSKSRFNKWAASVSHKHNPLTINAYAKIAAPSVNNKAEFYSSVHPHLFDMIMNQFMLPNHNFYKRQANKLVTGV